MQKAGSNVKVAEVHAIYHQQLSLFNSGDQQGKSIDATTEDALPSQPQPETAFLKAISKGGKQGMPPLRIDARHCLGLKGSTCPMNGGTARRTHLTRLLHLAGQQIQKGCNFPEEPETRKASLTYHLTHLLATKRSQNVWTQDMGTQTQTGSSSSSCLHLTDHLTMLGE